jgi:hypothetical protein
LAIIQTIHLSACNKGRVGYYGRRDNITSIGVPAAFTFAIFFRSEGEGRARHFHSGSSGTNGKRNPMDMLSVIFTVGSRVEHALRREAMMNCEERQFLPSQQED